MRRRWSWFLAVGLAGGVACSLGEQVDTDAPVVTILSPQANSTVSGLVVFSAQVLDGFGVDKVRFLVDGNLLAEDQTEPYSVNWQTSGAGNGPHALRVEATDFAGNSSFTSIGVTVDNSRQ